jgi:hypothetical protein
VEEAEGVVPVVGTRRGQKLLLFSLHRPFSYPQRQDQATLARPWTRSTWLQVSAYALENLFLVQLYHLALQNYLTLK